MKASEIWSCNTRLVYKHKESLEKKHCYCNFIFFRFLINSVQPPGSPLDTGWERTRRRETIEKTTGCAFLHLLPGWAQKTFISSWFLEVFYGKPIKLLYLVDLTQKRCKGDSKKSFMTKIPFRPCQQCSLLVWSMGHTGPLFSTCAGESCHTLNMIA